MPKRDDDELSIFRPVLDIVGYDRDIAEIEGGVNLIHEVQRCRLWKDR